MTMSVLAVFLAAQGAFFAWRRHRNIALTVEVAPAPFVVLSALATVHFVFGW